MLLLSGAMSDLSATEYIGVHTQDSGSLAMSGHIENLDKRRDRTEAGVSGRNGLKELP